MELIVDHSQEKNYYLNLREFPSGAFEAVMTVVKPMSSERMEAIIDGLPVVPPCDKPLNLKPKTQEEKDQLRKANHNRAVRRARQHIRWLSKVLQADRLFTLTYRKNQEDREEVHKDFTRFLRLVRTGFSVKHADGTKTNYRPIADWQYVAVIEKQTRGAYHIHCAVKGFQFISTLRAAWYKALGANGDETGQNTLGQVDVTTQDKRFGASSREWKTNKLAGYLVKYLHKTFDEVTSEKKRYWHARELKKPAVQRIWIGGTNIVEALKCTYEVLRLHVGRQPGADIWLSSYEDYFWISGVGDS